MRDVYAVCNLPLMFLKFPISLLVCDPEDRERAERLNIESSEVQEVGNVYVDPDRIESFYPSYVSHSGDMINAVSLRMHSGDEFTVLSEMDTFLIKLDKVFPLCPDLQS